MPINVTCPSCYTRFRVDEKFAGRSGKCPKCQGPITVPLATDTVKIHSPQNFGPKTTSGQAVLKPLRRMESKISTNAIVIIVAGALVLFLVAFLVGRSYPDHQVPPLLLGIGALLVAPPVVLGGYAFLRDQENLSPLRGKSLWIRVAICSVAYAALWGVYYFIKWRMGLIPSGVVQPFPLPAVVVILPIMVVGGAVTAVATLDLESTNAGFHYGLYLILTILLRLTMGLVQF